MVHCIVSPSLYDFASGLIPERRAVLYTYAFIVCIYYFATFHAISMTESKKESCRYIVVRNFAKC